jgi:hypothetical protein
MSNKQICVQYQKLKEIILDDKTGIKHNELLNRKDGLFQIISEIKSVQWKIVNFTVLIFIAIIGLCQLIVLRQNNLIAKSIICFGLCILTYIIYLFSIEMLFKTENDLKLYRGLTELNENLMSEITGIIDNSNEYIKLKLQDTNDRFDFEFSRKENTKYFTKPFLFIVSISGLITCILIIYLVLNT